MSNEIIFYNKGGRPKSLSKKEAHEAKLEAKKKWRDANKERIELYNELYRGGSKKKSKKSRKGSKKDKRKGSIRSIKKVSRKHSKKHSKKYVSDIQLYGD